jgi:hypothetical protein
MKHVELQLPLSDSSSTSRTIAGDFSIKELDTLTQFVTFMSRIRNCALLLRGMGGFKQIKFDKEGITIKSSSCTDSELYELLHVMRPVTLESERASFKNVASLLGRHLRSEELDQFIKMNRRVFRDGEMSLYMQFTVNSQKLFDESLLKTWLNGTQYHTDDDKAQAWSKLEKALGDENAKAIVLAQLHGKIAALMNIDYIGGQVLSASNCETEPLGIRADSLEGDFLLRMPQSLHISVIRLRLAPY